MISSILIGRKGSKGLPGKNTMSVLGRPLCSYPMLAATNAPSIDRHFVCTDDEFIAEIAKGFGMEAIPRPPELNTDEALGEEVYKYVSEVIGDKYGEQELLVLLMCNSPMILGQSIEKGLRVLRENQDYDSAVSVSKYNMYSPIRARCINEQGLLDPFIPFSRYDNADQISCDRNCMKDTWFADMGVSIIRPWCLSTMETNLPPQRWMGNRIYPLKQRGGLDADYDYQIPQVDFWLRAAGFDEARTPYEDKPVGSSRELSEANRETSARLDVEHGGTAPVIL
ncbi:MAG: cytidylyltransferase [Pseudomonadota bacterium]